MFQACNLPPENQFLDDLNTLSANAVKACVTVNVC
jgi:hypothetical protein